jgi:hypothetical protein
LISWFNAVFDGDSGLFNCYFSKALIEDPCLTSLVTVAGVFGVKWLD